MPASPPADADLHETLDLLGTLMASVSDRVDRQTASLDKLGKTAAEARQAAFAARSQTDPKLFANQVSAALLPTMRELTDAVSNLSSIATDHHGRLRKAEAQAHDATRDLRSARRELARWKGYLPGVALGSLVLALLLALAAPRLLADYPMACRIMGGIWSTNGQDWACVFRAS